MELIDYLIVANKSMCDNKEGGREGYHRRELVCEPGASLLSRDVGQVFLPHVGDSPFWVWEGFMGS